MTSETDRLKIKLQLYCGDEIAIGPEKADLLEAIDREGSISAAGRAMGMSYRRTWLLVDAHEQVLGSSVGRDRDGRQAGRWRSRSQAGIGPCER